MSNKKTRVRPGFSGRLKALVGALPARDFADLVDIGESQICEFLSAKRTPGLATLIKLAQGCDVSLDYLVGLSDKVEVRQLSNKEKVQLITEKLTKDPDSVQSIFELVVLPVAGMSNATTKEEKKGAQCFALMTRGVEDMCVYSKGQGAGCTWPPKLSTASCDRVAAIDAELTKAEAKKAKKKKAMKPEVEEGKIYRVAGAAEIIGVSRPTVVKLIREKRLRAKNVAMRGATRKMYRISAAAIKELIGE